MPKYDGCVHWIINLCQLNKVIRCKQYLLPIITNILCKRSGYKFFMKLDIIRASVLSFTPFVNYKYLRLPMGLKCSPDIAVSIMESVLAGINDADVYIDDVAFSHIWDDHVKLLGVILCHLHENGFVNWLTPRGLKLKKIDVILHIEHPRNSTELCMLIGCVICYQYTWPSCTHILKPLTDHSGLKIHASIPRTSDMQAAINKMHTTTNGLKYPDASDYQLGACIVQECQPVAYFPVIFQSHSKIIWQWKRKCYPFQLHLTSFEVCSSVLTSISSSIIKT
ncbi:hypothetical protein ACHAW6_002313 [Cyclotella cf. meneghiniana]